MNSGEGTGDGSGGALKALLPGDAGARLQSLRLVGGRAILVLDAAGLGSLARERLEVEIKGALSGAAGVSEVHVAMMADKAEPVPAPRKGPRIIAVGSGKGGVGKSTLAANLAVALARSGRKVGLVDADIYGPSQARLLGTEGTRAVAHQGKLVPVQSPCGVPVLSMAHLTPPGQAIAWRGPKIAGALIQLVEAHWDSAELLVIDLPPGTGDVQLTMLQRFKPAGAVIVSTPQDLALMDAARAAELFTKGGVPVIGVVENMAGYACPHCGEVSDPFGSGGAEDAAREMNVPFLGRIPLHIAIRREGDAGTPTAAGEGPQAEAFAALAQAVGEWLDTAPLMAVTRRGILVGALAGGGLALGYMLRPRSYPFPLEPGDGEFAFDAWIKIGSDGVVTVAVPQVEMGQGITTLIPQVVAHELGADWRQVAVEPAPVSALYANLALAAKWAPLWMPLAPSLADQPEDLLTRRWAQDRLFNVTADGTELAAYEGPARAAAASARAMLMQAAATRWNVSWEECEAANGFVTHEGKRLPFGPLAEEAAAFSPPSPRRYAPKPWQSGRASFPGAPLRYPRLDLPAKVDGSLTFAGDVRLPGMVHAAIAHAPIGLNTSISGLDEAAVKGMRGYLGIVRGMTNGGAWVAAVATDGWTAQAALTRMAPRFKVAAGADSNLVDAAMDEAMHTADAATIHTQGDRESLRGGLPLQLRYEVAPALHIAIETAAAAAHFSEGRLELWAGTQAPQAAREAAARAIGIDARDVVLYPMAIGGSFDRRLENEPAVEAAVIAKAIGKPVQLAWTRREEFRAGLPRAPVAAVMGARVDAEGSIAGWRVRIAVPATAREFGRRLLDGDTPFAALDAVAGKADPMAVEGAVPPYDIPNLVVDHVPVKIGLPTARMRGNAHAWTAFFNESFVDELAHKAGREPLSYRMAMLGKDTRLAECLQRVAALSQWGGGGDASGQGIACHVMGEGRIAVVASARRDENGVRVDRLSVVADIGRIVNFDIARQQIEGGLVFGLGLALGCSVRYEGGRPDSESLGAMGLPTLADCPAIEVEFIDSKAPPADPGELGVAAVAPAVANALYSATGLRLRRLPFFGEDL